MSPSISPRQERSCRDPGVPLRTFATGAKAAVGVLYVKARRSRGGSNSAAKKAKEREHKKGHSEKPVLQAVPAQVLHFLGGKYFLSIPATIT